MCVKRDRCNRSISVSRKRYLEKVFSRFEISDAPKNQTEKKFLNTMKNSYLMLYIIWVWEKKIYPVSVGLANTIHKILEQGKFLLSSQILIRLIKY